MASNDEANHRIALTAFPNFVDDPEQDTKTGLHHTAFEYGGFEELNASLPAAEGGRIVPELCLDHGMTFSYYYRDPDGNHVELQADNFGDWAKSSAFMREGPEFHDDPIGQFVDPERVAEAAAAGASFEEIHARAMAGEFAPETRRSSCRRWRRRSWSSGSPAPLRASGRRSPPRSRTRARA